jgi:hypothetical protein
LILIFITVSCEFTRPSKVLLLSLILALALNFVSIRRAYGADFTLSHQESIREKDRILMKIGADYYSAGRKGPVILGFSDVAYANFPVKVVLAAGQRDMRSESTFFILDDH